MPTYEYACRSCGEQLEVVQSFTDEPLTVCPACGGELRKVFRSVGIVFKGSGFYKTDSRPAESAGSSSSGSSTTGASSSEKSGSTPSEKPAASESTSTPTTADKPAAAAS